MFPSLPPSTGSRSDPKPALQGVRNKVRKGVQKATAKFEPLQFRDQLLKHLQSVPLNDYDAVAAKLDTLGNQLDYRKYEQQLFELLLVGALLAPGGGFENEKGEFGKSNFSVLSCATVVEGEKESVDGADMKKIVDVFNKLMRRYKYLQKPFEETALRGILQYVNKFTPLEQEKLATATALFVITGLASSNVLLSLRKDHLVKDSTSLTFLLKFLKTYLTLEPLDSLTTSLRKSSITDLESFLPSSVDFVTTFKSHGLGGVVEWVQRFKVGQVREEVLGRLGELRGEDAGEDDIISYLQTVQKKSLIPDPDLISLIYLGLFSNLDSSRTGDQVVRDVVEISGVLESFARKGSVQVALINTIQIWCYENSKLIPVFPKILKVLYSKDVLSDQSIIYWHSKGAKPQAKQVFLDLAKPLVDFLQEEDEEEEEEAEDEDDEE